MSEDGFLVMDELGVVDAGSCGGPQATPGSGSSHLAEMYSVLVIYRVFFLPRPSVY